MKKIITYILPIFLLSCADKKVQFENVEEKLVDSFIVNNDYLCEAININQLNDSMLYTFNYTDNFIKYYIKQGKNYNLKYKKYLKHNTFQTFVKVIHPNLYLVKEGSRKVLFLDSNLNVLNQYTANDTKKYLKQNYVLMVLNERPMIYKDSFLYITYSHSDLASYSNWIKEYNMSKYRLGTNQYLILEDNILPKPKDLLNFQFSPSSFFCDKNNIHTIFSCFDTLYTYNIKSNTETKKHIGNKEYKLPAKWDYTKLGTSEFNGYNNKYTLNNFKYHSIYFNENTNHFMFFYSVPKDKVSTSLHVLVTDTNLENHKYYDLTRSKYLYYDDLFFIKNKGLAIPHIIRKNDETSPVQYFIFNF